MAAMRISAKNVFLMLGLIVFWGSSFIVVKITLKEGLTPIAVATFRFLIAGALFLVTLLFRRSRNRSYSLSIDRKDASTIVLLALTGVTFFFTAQYTGIEMAGASIAAILVCLLSPILINVLSARIFKERLTKKHILGVGVAAIGTFMVVVAGTLSIQGGASFFMGSLILLSTPFLWAAYSLAGKKLIEKYDAFLVVSYVSVLGGLLLVPFSMAEGSLHQALSMSLHGWLAILYLSTTCSVLGYYIWFYVLKQVGPAVTSSFLFAEPLITVAFAVAFIGETLNWPIVVGGFLIFVGVYFVARK